SVGAGTIRRKEDITNAADAGAVFGVSPGTPPALRDDIRASAMPFLPGCATVSEAMALHDAGFYVVKLFPAEAVGGRDFLRAIHAPLPDLAFCPTGGLTAASAPAYLALANVACVGGSWMLPKSVLQTGDWVEIGRLARQAASLRAPGDP
ncbi:MAG: bifunctional 4-hydroxy-2-oxoglutarate aldolase/2-dehydro-3-deoxy-phosphogluconate aldolase, partial [Gemmobacter sp.]